MRRTVLYGSLIVLVGVAILLLVRLCGAGKKDVVENKEVVVSNSTEVQSGPQDEVPGAVGDASSTIVAEPVTTNAPVLRIVSPSDMTAEELRKALPTAYLRDNAERIWVQIENEKQFERVWRAGLGEMPRHDISEKTPEHEAANRASLNEQTSRAQSRIATAIKEMESLQNTFLSGAEAFERSMPKEEYEALQHWRMTWTPPGFVASKPLVTK